MKLIIPKQHIKVQLKKFGYKDADDGVYDLINDYHQAFVRHLVSKRNFKSKYQKGGRVSFPLEYFGGNTSAYSASPSYTDTGVTDTLIRPPVLLHDPSGGLATPKAMEPLVGGGTPLFQVSKTSCKNAIQQLNVDTHGVDKQNLIEDTKQKIEKLMTRAINKAKKTSQSSTLKERDLSGVLTLQSYKNFKL